MKLTGNDIALAQEAAAMAIAYWKDRPGARTNYVRGRIAQYKELISKLSKISDIAYPYDSSDDMPMDVGDEEIMKLDTRVVDKTRARAMPERTVQ